MSNKQNARRGDERRTETGPRYENGNPGAGCNSTHVARGRAKWKRIVARKERKGGEVEVTTGLEESRDPIPICEDCRAPAVWFYMPVDGSGTYCDACVPRGCSCNETVDGVQERDDKGRCLPCCEYDYRTDR